MARQWPGSEFVKGARVRASVRDYPVPRRKPGPRSHTLRVRDSWPRRSPGNCQINRPDFCPYHGNFQQASVLKLKYSDLPLPLHRLRMSRSGLPPAIPSHAGGMATCSSPSPCRGGFGDCRASRLFDSRPPTPTTSISLSSGNSLAKRSQSALSHPSASQPMIWATESPPAPPPAAPSRSPCIVPLVGHNDPHGGRRRPQAKLGRRGNHPHAVPLFPAPLRPPPFRRSGSSPPPSADRRARSR